MRSRLLEEVNLLASQFSELKHIEVEEVLWVLIPNYPLPPGWRIGEEARSSARLVFQINPTYPEGEPYGFLLPAGINFGGSEPGSSGSPPSAVPFDGEWHHFSWAPEEWAPSVSIGAGANLLAWARSFSARLREGA